VNTSNALTLRMFEEQLCLLVPPKLFGVSSGIKQRIPDCSSSGLRRCYGKFVEPTVDDIWQLVIVY